MDIQYHNHHLVNLRYHKLIKKLHTLIEILNH
jgi:hypothetical protein